MIGENGENKFKVELARTPILEDQNATPTPGTLSRTSSSTGRVPTLSLYVTSLFLDFAHPEYEFGTAIMVAIKSREDRAGDRGARSDWVWEHWDSGFVFRKGSEYWGELEVRDSHDLTVLTFSSSRMPTPSFVNLTHTQSNRITRFPRSVYPNPFTDRLLSAVPSGLLCS